MEEWHSLRSIRFSKKEMWWLTFHLDEIKQGRWPENPRQSETGYIETGIKVKRYREPSQNKVLEIAAEVEIRLELVMGYISGWERPARKIKRQRRRSRHPRASPWSPAQDYEKVYRDLA